MKIFKLVNIPIFLSAFLLVSIGILVIYSSSKELGFQQLLFATVGVAFALLISRLDIESLKNFINPLYVIVTVLLLAVFILGIETRGTLRWIPLGIFNIQPSEFAKPVLILFLAKFWSEKLPSWGNIIKSLFWIIPYFLLIFIQPDLGSALTIIAIWLGVMFAARVSVRKILILALIIIIAAPSSWVFLHDYQRQRILGFLAPQSDPLGKGYNLIQSTVAVGSGQLSGRGLGRGTQSRLQFLPEFRTDFIFASIGEEMGFVGSVLILLLYIYLLLYSIRIALKSNSHFIYLIVFGVVSMVLFQVFVNIGMNIGLTPITGITLPLISYGGSSLVATLLSLGIVASAARKR